MKICITHKEWEKMWRTMQRNTWAWALELDPCGLDWEYKLDKWNKILGNQSPCQERTIGAGSTWKSQSSKWRRSHVDLMPLLLQKLIVASILCQIYGDITAHCQEFRCISLIGPSDLWTHHIFERRIHDISIMDQGFQHDGAFQSRTKC